MDKPEKAGASKQDNTNEIATTDQIDGRGEIERIGL
jgi:hypothetical protein